MKTETAKNNGKVGNNGASKNGASDSKGNGKADMKVLKDQPVVEPKPIDVNQRVQKIKEARGLTIKTDRVIETLNRLREFKFLADDGSYLTISDRDNKEFSTTNSNLIELLVEHLEILLDGRAKQLEDQIVAFEI
ncbi:hypothetical protein COB64_03785 [Candidatus Wolfebacteria bacterium]|nr:MAG: hypothetical protein COB64_03785 [Candidatus Wolfebacteria bacterium]